MSLEIEFYFDFSSPNAYFSSVQIQDVQDRTGAELVYRPFFLGGVMKELETTPPVQQNELKARYMSKDLQRWSTKYDIPFTMPEAFPINTIAPMRGVLAARELSDGDAEPYVQEAFSAYWEEGRDISQREELSAVVDSVGLDRERFFRIIEEDRIKDEFRRLTDEAMDRGVFGTPTFFVGEEMFWGKDRLEFVEDEIKARSG